MCTRESHLLQNQYFCCFRFCLDFTAIDRICCFRRFLPGTETLERWRDRARFPLLSEWIRRTNNGPTVRKESDATRSILIGWPLTVARCEFVENRSRRNRNVRLSKMLISVEPWNLLTMSLSKNRHQFFWFSFLFADLIRRIVFFCLLFIRSRINGNCQKWMTIFVHIRKLGFTMIYNELFNEIKSIKNISFTPGPRQTEQTTIWN